ncbi:hypothetical protein [Variovorax sp. PAMC 28711]|nr:hypothetical protein [Variovorax sp. PAMC 28711]
MIDRLADPPRLATALAALDQARYESQPDRAASILTDQKCA